MLNLKNVTLLVSVYDWPIKGLDKGLAAARPFIESISFGGLAICSPGCDCELPEDMKSIGFVHWKTYAYGQSDCFGLSLNRINRPQVKTSHLLSIDENSVLKDVASWSDAFLNASAIHAGTFPILIRMNAARSNPLLLDVELFSKFCGKS
jgi:hypothetical protein